MTRIEWIDGEREPKIAPDPAYPHGKDINTVPMGMPRCKVDLPYPAKRCGVYIVECEECGVRIGVTTAGRTDDPRSVAIPCKKH